MFTENFLMYMDNEINPYQLLWVIRKNQNNETYLDVGKCFGFKVGCSTYKSNKHFWKIGIISLLTNQKIYSNVSNINDKIFFNFEDAIDNLIDNPNAIILHYCKRYIGTDDKLYAVSKIDKTSNGIIYTLINNDYTTKTITNSEIKKNIKDMLKEMIF